eukprot:12427530-Karenia_brevis.AAC.1
MTLPLAPDEWADLYHRAWTEIFDEYGPKMALIMPMKLVNIGDTNLGGINSRSWGTNVQMFHTAGQIDTLMDWRNDCKW